MKLDGNVYFTAGGKHQFCNLKEEKKKKKTFSQKMIHRDRKIESNLEQHLTRHYYLWKLDIHEIST